MGDSAWQPHDPWLLPRMLSMCSLSLQAVSAMPALTLKHKLPAGPVYYADEHHGGETQKRIDEEVTKLLKGAYSRVETLLVGEVLLWS